MKKLASIFKVIKSDYESWKTTKTILGTRDESYLSFFIKYTIPGIYCQIVGHKWVNVDTGNAETGPIFHADCDRCKISV